MSKYKNIKVEVDGFKFDSKAEARYYGILKMRKLAGELDFERQVKYDLVVNGVLIGSYIADFVLNIKGKKEVVDVKSAMTKKLPVYRIKKKLMLAVYGIEIIEVK